MKKTVCALLCAALAVTLACPAFAAEPAAEVNEAGAYLRERGGPSAYPQHRSTTVQAIAGLTGSFGPYRELS